MLAGGLAGRSQLASLYSELRQAPQKMDAPACHPVDAPSFQQLPPQQPADWEWATVPSEQLGEDPLFGSQGSGLSTVQSSALNRGASPRGRL